MSKHDVNMNTPVTESDIERLKQRMKERARVLRAEIHDALLREDSRQFAQIAGQVHDSQEESVAHLLVDVSLAEITRDVEELRDIEGAFQRIAEGSYGVCIRCNEPIALERLEAYPTAKRCLECQRAYEHSRRGAPPPSL